MARHKDVNWDLPDGKPNPDKSGSNIHQWKSIQSALLMDLRDELKKLNALLHCPNFISIPQTLNDIRRNTTKKRRVKKQ